MGRTFAANPAWLLDVPGAQVKVREIQLRAARGLLIEEIEQPGPTGGDDRLEHARTRILGQQQERRAQ